MEEIPIPKFQQKTETEIKNYNVIKSVLSKLYDTENELLLKISKISKMKTKKIIF